MPKENAALLAFNRGLISRLALAREDLKRTALSAEIQTNWMPRVLGSMMLRPGLQYINGTKDNKLSVSIPFIFSTDDFASIELTDQKMRVIVDDTVLSRPAVTAVVTDGEFTSLSGWTQAHDTGATSTIADNMLNLVGTGFGAARIRQEVTPVSGEENTEHALEIVVDQGPVKLRVGSTEGGDEYVFETTLGTGFHNIAFTPSGSFWIELFTFDRYTVKVDKCVVSGGGILELDTPYVEADIRKIRSIQSADVVYVACKGYKQMKIERRSNNSWSLIDYQSTDGPFRIINITQTSITASGLNGDITLTSSERLFRDTNVGSLFQLTSRGQNVENNFTDENQEGDYIRVTGVGSLQRTFTIAWDGAITGVVTLQRSSGEPGNWIDAGTNTNPADGSSSTFYDGSAYNNQIVYYRFIIKSGDYTSGSTVASLQFDDGGITGVALVTGFTSETEVDAIVVKPLGSTTSTIDWSEGKWSPRRDYPTAVALHEGRLCWFGKGNINGSVSDAFESFDPEVEGDSAPIDRSIGSGPVDDIQWALSLNRLMVGLEGSETSVKSSSLDEPISPSNFNFKASSTQGSGEVAAVQVDSRGYFVQRSGTKLYELSIEDRVSYDYGSVDMMALVPELGDAGIIRIGVQRQPDTRIHCVFNDGTVGILVSEPAEEVLCWVLFETDGLVEEVEVLPGQIEDSVYYTVLRTINGVDVRYREKWALEKECRNGIISKLADSSIHYDGVSTNVIEDLDHLEGEEVIVWADGRDCGKKVVSSGLISLDDPASQVVVGLEYVADFQSAKLTYAAAAGTALTKTKTVADLGLVLADTHHRGLEYGLDFDELEPLPEVDTEYGDVAEHTVFAELDIEDLPVEHGWTTDSRLCLRATAPRACTVLAVVIDQQTNG